MADINAGNLRKIQGLHIPKHLLNDLSSRFIINVPEEERVDLTRLCFQIELAHWFYLDFYCEENPKLPKCTVREFIHIIFRHIPFLQKYNQEIDSVIADWREYKSAVPTYGAILLDHDLKKVLLVQSFYSKASWGFPKGKVNEDEKPHHCAIREVFEETGFDISHLIKNDEFLEHYFNDQLIRLYIITGISPDAKFQPQTRKEIRSVEWFPVCHLPKNRHDDTSRTKLGPNHFFMVIPFIKQLEKWITTKTTSMPQDKSIQQGGDKSHKTDKNFLKQQRLFSDLTKKDFAKFTNIEEGADNKANRPCKLTYSPPPRMIRHRKHENEKKNLNTEHHEERIIMNSKFTKKNFEDLKEMKKMTEENVLKPCMVWQNFSLDCEALVATFNINLRKSYLSLKGTI